MKLIIPYWDLIFFTTLFRSAFTSQKVEFTTKEHHDMDGLLNTLADVQTACPDITRVYSIGDSVEGRPLAVIQFHAGKDSDALRPSFKYVGNMHGNEVVGRELLLHLAVDLCNRYNNGDQQVRRLLNMTDIHLLPSMNPDGYHTAAVSTASERTWMKGRANANGVDLNRDFPDLDSMYYELRREHIPRADHLLEFFDDQTDRQPETRAVGRWTLSLPFVLSANLHEGDLVANYPFDMSSADDGHDQYSQTPDDATFRELALTYARAHAHMAKNDHSPCDQTEKDAFARNGGITNGARWYSLTGGMQDFNYLATNTFEITLELSCVKFPPASDLSELWTDNERALYAYMWATHTGIKGLITDALTDEPIVDALVWVVNTTDAQSRPIAHAVTTNSDGAYWRLLTDGQYNIVIQANGYEPATQTVNVVNKEHHPAQRLDFQLMPIIEDIPTSYADEQAT